MSQSLPELEALAAAVGRAAEKTRQWRERSQVLENRVRQMETELEELRQVSGNAKAEVDRLQRNKSDIRSRLDRIRQNLATLEEPAHQSTVQKN